MTKGARKEKKNCILAKALTRLPVSGIKAILCKFLFFTYRRIHVFETSKLRHGKWLFEKFKNTPWKKIIYSGKTLFDRHKNNTAIGGWITSLKKIIMINFTVFHFKTSLFFFLMKKKKKKMNFLAAGALSGMSS